MAWDGVPWFVGGGAEHSPEVARLLSYAAFGGAEGIVGTGDLRVTEQDVPDDTVRVLPGACAILNRASAQEYQAYAARLPSADDVEISPTDSSGGRSDLIVARVEDPYLSGEPWDEPSDPAAGPYVYTRVVSNVPDTTTSLQEVNPGESGIALARIDIPASTGTIEQSMITDLRKMVVSRRETVQKVRNLTADEDGEVVDNTSPESWTPTFEVDVPEWATRAVILTNVGGYQLIEQGTDGGNVVVRMRTSLGGISTQATEVNHEMQPGAGRLDTAATVIAGDYTVPDEDRGSKVTLALEAWKTGGSNLDLRSGWGTAIAHQITFYEAPDA